MIHDNDIFLIMLQCEEEDTILEPESAIFNIQQAKIKRKML